MYKNLIYICFTDLKIKINILLLVIKSNIFPNFLLIPIIYKYS